MKAGPEWLKAPNSTTAGIDAHCGTDNSLKRKSLFDLAALVRSVASGLLLTWCKIILALLGPGRKELGAEGGDAGCINHSVTSGTIHCLHFQLLSWLIPHGQAPLFDTG